MGSFINDVKLEWGEIILEYYNICATPYKKVWMTQAGRGDNTVNPP